MRLLVADDDPDIVSLLQGALGRSGHAVDAVTCGPEAIWMATEIAYDAILLDVSFPPPDGFEVCRRLRAAGVWTPVLFLPGRDEIDDRVEGLDAGADDYLVKPFSLAELDARLRAATRRQSAPRPAVLQCGDLTIDPAKHLVHRGDVEIALSPKEFALLETLARRPGETVSRGDLHQTLWDFAFDGRSNVIDALVRRLRTKVDVTFDRHSVETVRSVGYRLVTDDEPPPTATRGEQSRPPTR